MKNIFTLTALIGVLLSSCATIPPVPAYVGTWEGYMAEDNTDQNAPRGTFVLTETTFEMTGPENERVKGSVVVVGAEMTLTAQFQARKGEEYIPFEGSGSELKGTWSVKADKLIMNFGGSQMFSGTRKK